MLPEMDCGGWVARMHAAGYRVSSRTELFGRQSHVIRCRASGEHLVLRQGFKQESRNLFTDLTPNQLRILTAFFVAGTLSGPDPALAVPATAPDPAVARLAPQGPSRHRAP